MTPNAASSLPPLPVEDLDFVQNWTSSLWEEARGKSFFITGGTGFFGIWLLESFIYINGQLGLDAKATVLTRDPEHFLHKLPHLANRNDLSFVRGDIRDFSFPEGNFDYVIHAATEASAKLNEESPHEMLDAIAGGMRHLLSFACRAKVKKLLFTSSGAVYGKQPANLSHVSEDYLGAPDSLHPGSAYGEGKRVAELMGVIHASRSACEVKIARCFAFIGPHLPLDSHFAIGNFLKDALQRNTIKVGGDGTAHRSYLYAADLTIWLWTILFNGRSSRAYNVGSDESLSIAAIASKVSESLGSQSAVAIGKLPVPGQLAARYVPQINRGRTELNLKVFTSLADSILKTAHWYGWTSPDGSPLRPLPRKL